MAKAFAYYDVVIAGGGVIGSAAAHFLTAHLNFDGRVAVIEKDPTYVDCSTSRSAGDPPRDSGLDATE